MTRRLTLAGLAAVAALWGPYVYAELAREPLKPPADDPSPIAVQPVVETTPVAYEPSPVPSLAVDEPGHTTLGASIDPDRPVEPLDEHPVEPLAADLELGEPPIDPRAQPPSAAKAVEPAVQLAPPAQAAAADPSAQPPPPAAGPSAPGAEPPATPADPAAPSDEAQAKAPAEAQAKAPAEAQAKAPAEAQAKAPAEDEAAEKSAAAEVDPHAKAVRDGNLNVIPDAIAPAFRSAFDKESRDVIWAAKEEPRLNSFLSNAGVPSSAVTEVRCQRTVCRVAINVTLVPPTAQTQLYDRAQREFGAGLALDPTKDQGAAFYVMRRPQ